MGKFKPKKLGITVFFSIVITLGIVAFADADNEFGVNIRPPALTFFCSPDGTISEKGLECDNGKLLSDGDDPQPIGSVACWMNVELKIKGNNGIVRGTEKSSFFKTNPTHIFSLTDRGSDLGLDFDIDKGTYLITPSIKCNSDKVSYDPIGDNTQFGATKDPKDSESDLFGIFPLSLGQPLVIEQNNLVIRIYAENSDGTFKDVYNSQLLIKEKEIFNTESRELGTKEIDPSLTTKFLNEGQYDSNHKFAVEGFILMHWKETENCPINPSPFIASCADIQFVIPIETVQVFKDGKLVSVTNPLMTERLIGVDLGEGEGGNGGDDTNGGDDEEKTCPSGQTRIGGICRVGSDDGGNGGTTCEQRNDCDEVNPITEIFDAFTTCLGSGDLTCVTNGQFLPFYLGGFGFLLLIGAVAQKGAREPDIYGVPY